MRAYGADFACLLVLFRDFGKLSSAFWRRAPCPKVRPLCDRHLGHRIPRRIRPPGLVEESRCSGSSTSAGLRGTARISILPPPSFLRLSKKFLRNQLKRVGSVRDLLQLILLSLTAWITSICDDLAGSITCRAGFSRGFAFRIAMSVNAISGATSLELERVAPIWAPSRCGYTQALVNIGPCKHVSEGWQSGEWCGDGTAKIA